MSSHELGFFDRPKNINRVIWGLVILCIGFVVADLFYHNHHPHFDLETQFGFQAWFGFLAFVIIVFIGRGLRLLISRPEDYYDAEESDEFSHPVADTSAPKSEGGNHA